MIDMVPKAIVLTLVNHSKENLQRELLQELYKPEVLDDLMKESDFVVNRRKEVVSMVTALNKAEEYVESSLIRLDTVLTMHCHIGSLLGFRYGRGLMQVFCMRSCCAYGLITSINTLYTICSTWC
jgi:hypothetical protein